MKKHFELLVFINYIKRSRFTQRLCQFAAVARFVILKKTSTCEKNDLIFTLIIPNDNCQAFSRLLIKSRRDKKKKERKNPYVLIKSIA